MTTATITYMRFDGTNVTLPAGSTLNYFLTVYHVNGSTLTGTESLATLQTFVNNNANVRQKINTTTIINKTICEWDNLTTQISNMNSNSALIVFVIQKIQSGTTTTNNYVDYYVIINLLSSFQTNPNLVYNTDNYYLLEMNSAINTFDNLVPKPTKSPSGVVIRSDTSVQNSYNTNYYGPLGTNFTNEAVSSGQTVPEVLSNVPLSNTVEQGTMTTFNDTNRPPFYTKYVADNAYSAVDVINKMTKKIYNTKCVVPFSRINRTTTSMSAVRFTIHYTM